jgi:hypothetical protein
MSAEKERLKTAPLQQTRVRFGGTIAHVTLTLGTGADGAAGGAVRGSGRAATTCLK